MTDGSPQFRFCSSRWEKQSPLKGSQLKEKMWGSSRPIAKIRSRNEYYYFTSERVEKGYFKLYSSEKVSVTSDEIKRPPQPVAGKITVVRVIPRDYITNLNPAKDFILKTRVSCGKNDYTFGEFSLGEVLTPNTFGRPDYLSYALISSGEPTLDLDDHLVILSSMVNPIPKFKDDKIIEKLTRAMHEAIARATSSNWPEFTFENTPEDPEKKIVVKVSVSLSKEAKEKFTGKECGKFTLPDKPLPEQTEESKK